MGLRAADYECHAGISQGQEEWFAMISRVPVLKSVHFLLLLR